MENISDLLQHLRELLIQGRPQVLLGALKGKEALGVGLVGVHKAGLNLLQDLVELILDRLEGGLLHGLIGVLLVFIPSCANSSHHRVAAEINELHV